QHVEAPDRHPGFSRFWARLAASLLTSLAADQAIQLMHVEHVSAAAPGAMPRHLAAIDPAAQSGDGDAAVPRRADEVEVSPHGCRLLFCHCCCHGCPSIAG